MAEFDDLKFTFLYIDLYSMGAGWYYPESSIPYNMLRYIVKGEAEFSVNGEKFTVKENDIIYSQDEDGNTVANTKQFICKQEPGIGTVTKKVNYMLFEEYKGNL